MCINTDIVLEPADSTVLFVILRTAVNVPVKLYGTESHVTPTDKRVMEKYEHLLVVLELQIIVDTLEDTRLVLLVVVASYQDFLAMDLIKKLRCLIGTDLV